MPVRVGEVDIATLEDFFEPSTNLTPVQFAERYGDAFLLQPEGPFGLKPPSGPIETVVGVSLGGQAGGHRLDCLVWPIRPSPGGRSMFFSVGRTLSNHVSIPDSSVSKTHALMSRTKDGAWKVRTAPEATPVLVNGQPLDDKGAVLENGDTLRLGSVDLSFLDASSMRVLASRVGGRSG